MHRRSGALVTGALLLTTVLAGCAAGGSGDAAPTPTRTKAAATPGKASCHLSSGGGSVSLEETADAYRVEWKGVPTDDGGQRNTYEVQLGNEGQTKHIGLYIEFDSITGTTYGLFNSETNDVDPVPGEPDVSNGTVVGTFPKQEDIDAVYWAPSYGVVNEDGADTTWCTEDGQVLDWTPLD
ncbi:hypothetical protein [Curtobacterium pusillum]|uniref:hypothetical protein n=1 Tax=Curtobacterium pusillum TaxID=69373 RepID=UPI0011A3AE4C|nr:hypothetical protein [Curtobacterium pusillum]